MVPTVVRQNQAFGAILLQAFPTLRASMAGIDKGADSNSVTSLKPGYFVTHGVYHTGDFVPRNHWKYGAAPLVASLMDVGVTDPAVLNVDGDIVFLRHAPREFIGRQGSFGRESGVTSSFCCEAELLD